MTRHTYFVLTLALVFSLFSCTTKRELSEQELKQLSELKSELVKIDADIQKAEVDNAGYSGGLLKNLVQLRIEILKTTRALVEQRVHAIESGTPMTTVVTKTTPDSQLVKQLDDEIERQTLAVKAAQEATGYYGGLIGALKQTNLATEENTLAILKQRRMMAKYGLVLPELPVSESTPESKLSSKPQATISIPPKEPSKAFKIVEIDSRVTESNDVWHKYAWKLTLKNLSAEAIRCDAKIEFQDSDGFVIDDDNEYGLVLKAKETKTFTGYKLITASVAHRVDKINAKVKLD